MMENLTTYELCRLIGSWVCFSVLVIREFKTAKQSCVKGMVFVVVVIALFLLLFYAVFCAIAASLTWYETIAIIAAGAAIGGVAMIAYYNLKKVVMLKKARSDKS